MNQTQYQILNSTVIGPLKEAGAKVWIFGSRARGDHRKFSDVDLLYEFPEGLSPPKGFIFDIKSELEESRFHFKLDLVDVKELASSYRDNVLGDRLEL